jgi:hypothetical protein
LYPLIPYLTITLFSFPAAEKKQNAAAAPDAMEVSTGALTVHPAPAEAEKKVNGDFVLRLKCTIHTGKLSVSTD